MELDRLTVPELLTTHGAILEELRRREIVRSANNPISDLAVSSPACSAIRKVAVVVTMRPTDKLLENKYLCHYNAMII